MHARAGLRAEGERDPSRRLPAGPPRPPQGAGRSVTVSSRLPAGPDPAGVVTVDCATCVVRGHGCADCVVALLLGPPDGALSFDSGQARALDVLAGCGLVPPLRHTDAVTGGGGPPSPADEAGGW